MQCLANMKRTHNAVHASAVLGLAAWFILSAGCARSWEEGIPLSD